MVGIEPTPFLGYFIPDSNGTGSDPADSSSAARARPISLPLPAPKTFPLIRTAFAYYPQPLEETLLPRQYASGCCGQFQLQFSYDVTCYLRLIKKMCGPLRYPPERTARITQPYPHRFQNFRRGSNPHRNIHYPPRTCESRFTGIPILLRRLRSGRASRHKRDNY